ncbi:hypothetical protein ES703_99018 [subsurface metagenome]
MGIKTSKKKSKGIGVRYIVNAKGEKTEVVVLIELYKQLLKRLEDVEDIRDFDEAMEDPEWEDFEKVAKRLGL